MLRSSTTLPVAKCDVFPLSLDSLRYSSTSPSRSQVSYSSIPLSQIEILLNVKAYIISGPNLSDRNNFFVAWN